MSTIIEQAVAKIKSQQPKAKNEVWAVGEHLKDICRTNPADAELVLKDLDVPELSIEEAEKKLKKYADSHKSGNFGFVPPTVADDILRKFYGLSERGAPSVLHCAPSPSTPPKSGAVEVDLDDFL